MSTKRSRALVSRSGSTALGLVLLSGTAGHGAVTFRTVALTGQAAPGTAVPPGQPANFNNFSTPPVINQAGQVAFIASLTGTASGNGIWTEGGGAGLRLVARQGVAAPGTTGTFSQFSNSTVSRSVHIDNAGRVAFLAAATGGQGLWSEAGGGSLRRVAQVGSTFEPFSFSFNADFELAMSRTSGRLTFGASIPSTTCSGDLSTIWREDGQFVLQLIDQPIQRLPAELECSEVVFEYPTINGSGQVAYDGPALRAITGGLSTPSAAIYVSNGLNATPNTPAPGAGSGVQFKGPVRASLNDAGQYAFRTQLVNSQGTTVGEGIFVQSGSGFRLVALTGTAAPGTDPGVTFSSFNSFGSTPLGGSSINRFGRAAFRAQITLADSVTTSAGIWRECNDGQLSLVALLGSVAPGGGTFTELGDPVVNRGGLLAFKARISGVPGSDEGIWAIDPSGMLTKIVRDGEQIDVNNDSQIVDLRTIAALRTAADPHGIGGFPYVSGGEDGRVSPFSISGQITFQATFTVGGSGIFVATPDVSWAAPRCLGDADGNGVVNFTDYSAVFINWLRHYPCGTGPGDANLDGTVNSADTTSVSVNWSEVCP